MSPLKLTDLSGDLSGRLLVATPVIKDRAFRKSVILVCAHSEKGAIGVLINRPALNMTLRRLFVEKDLQPPRVPLGLPVHAGGPAGIDGVVTLHTPIEPGDPKGVQITETISITPGTAVLRRLAEQNLLANAFIAMGHCAWGPGALEAELGRGMWLTLHVEDEDLFDTPAGDRWERAMHQMRVTPSNLSGVSGYA
ncbi:YqgE/AlgH family protein [Jannaschia formosa]|uniref:YqgE/AlgH family protein n=1 Tax=Jannaschia formosa TaxID=2259592 RepID=UPI000E1C3766|nr:YqgE/AlgH family protein [Jannaschia formosa]TFL16074.1 hypothetical protein DR046_22015 [Jannaschia formosa]